MIVSTPELIGRDINSNSETSVKSKIKAYKNLLKMSDEEARKMIIALPSLLCYDFGDGKSSMKSKIEKLQQTIPFEHLRNIAIENPLIFSAPAQSFKIRYMMASVMDKLPQFLSCGFMVNEKKVWARLCHLIFINSTAVSYIYINEKVFIGRFGASSEDLLKKYPLDEKAVKEIERAYFEKTGEKMTLDENELTQLGIER